MGRIGIIFLMILTFNGCLLKPQKKNVYTLSSKNLSIKIVETMEQGERSKIKKELLSKREERDEDGQCYLHKAAYIGDLNLIEYMIDNDFDPNVKDKEGRTFLHILLRRYTLRFINFTEVPDESKLIIIFSKITGDKSKKFDINGVDKNGLSYLHYCVEAKLKFLMECIVVETEGVDVNIKSYFKNATPLHFATIRGNKKAVKMLLENGASPFARDKEGKTPMEWACEGGNMTSDEERLNKYVEICNLIVQYYSLSTVKKFRELKK